MPFRFCRVLIADDDPDVARLLTRMLEGSMHFVTEIAPTVDSALEKLSVTDILVVDLHMNGVLDQNVHGGNVIIDQWLKLKRGPTLVYSAYATQEVRADLLSRGVDNVLSKPLDHGCLRPVMQRLGECVLMRKRCEDDQKALEQALKSAQTWQDKAARNQLIAAISIAALAGSKIVPFLVEWIGGLI